MKKARKSSYLGGDGSDIHTADVTLCERRFNARRSFQAVNNQIAIGALR
jgi:hypothetical protein